MPCSCSLKINTPGASTAVHDGESCFNDCQETGVHCGVRASLSRNAVQQEEAMKLCQNYLRVWEQIFIFSLTKTGVYKNRESLPGRGS